MPTDHHMDTHNNDEALIREYLLPADIVHKRCVDDRQYGEDAETNTNGVELPGGVFGELDALKNLLKIDEETARALVIDSGIAIGAHRDEHHGDHGCGYGAKVEHEPHLVLAPEAVSLTDRLHWVKSVDGEIVTAMGEHSPTHAVINHVHGYSIDPDQAVSSNLGIFNFDTWAAVEDGKLLAQAARVKGFDLDPQAFADHLEDVYKATVRALSNINEFIELH